MKEFGSSIINYTQELAQKNNKGKPPKPKPSNGNDVNINKGGFNIAERRKERGGNIRTPKHPKKP